MSKATTVRAAALAAQERYAAAYNALEQLWRFPLSERAFELRKSAKKVQEQALHELGINPNDDAAVLSLERSLGLRRLGAPAR